MWRALPACTGPDCHGRFIQVCCVLRAAAWLKAVLNPGGQLLWLGRVRNGDRLTSVHDNKAWTAAGPLTFRERSGQCSGEESGDESEWIKGKHRIEGADSVGKSSCGHHGQAGFSPYRAGEQA